MRFMCRVTKYESVRHEIIRQIPGVQLELGESGVWHFEMVLPCYEKGKMQIRVCESNLCTRSENKGNTEIKVDEWS